jgi:HK97 family phage prohead protease
MNESRIAAAAKERSQQVVARADRPSQRRCAEVTDSRGYARVHATLEIRDQAEGDSWDFRGVASTTERGYEMYDAFGPYTEVVSRGAFTQTLNRANLDVPLVLSHDSLRRIARTTNGTLMLAETDDGLDVSAPALDPRDADVAYIAPKIRAGLIDEMSFMFRIDSGIWSPDYDEFRIDRVDIHRGDVSIVGYGANPYTSAELREQPAAAGDLRAVKLRLATAV